MAEKPGDPAPYRPVRIASGAIVRVPGGMPGELDDRLRTARTGDEAAEMIRAHQPGDRTCNCTGPWTQTVHASNPEGHQVGCPRWGAPEWPPADYLAKVLEDGAERTRRRREQHLWPPVAVKLCVFRTCDWTLVETGHRTAEDELIAEHLRTEHRDAIELMSAAIR